MAHGSAGTGDIQAVHRVAQILRLFTVNRPQVTVAEAAGLLGMNRTTVHRYFGSLVLDNILERSHQEPTAFVPGRLLLELGAVAQGQRNVLEIAPRHMRELSLETRCTVVLSLWGEGGAVVSQVAEMGTHPLLMTVRIGTTLGLDAAQTRLFAAFLRDQHAVAAYVARFAARERKAFEEDLPDCRQRGVCRNAVPESDAAVLAAAVFDEHDIAATIALVGGVSALPARAPDKEAALRRAAFLITGELGGQELWREVIADRSTAFLEAS